VLKVVAAAENEPAAAAEEEVEEGYGEVSDEECGAKLRLCEAHLKTEMLKAEEAEMRKAKDAEAEARLGTVGTQGTVLGAKHDYGVDELKEEEEEEAGARHVDDRGGRARTGPQFLHHLNGRGLNEDDEEEQETGYGLGKIDAGQVARMGLKVGVATAPPVPAPPAPAAAAAVAPAGREGGHGGADGEILYAGLLRRKKEQHGRFEDPYKMSCVCRLQARQPSLSSLFSLSLSFSLTLSPFLSLTRSVWDWAWQGSVLRVRLTHYSEAVGLEEQFDLGAEWRLMPRSDKPDRFSLNRIRTSPDGLGLSRVTLKAETKDEANGLPYPVTAHHCLNVFYSAIHRVTRRALSDTLVFYYHSSCLTRWS
jgi:hypothetical protein